MRGDAQAQEPAHDVRRTDGPEAPAGGRQRATGTWNRDAGPLAGRPSGAGRAAGAAARGRARSVVRPRDGPADGRTRRHARCGGTTVANPGSVLRGRPALMRALSPGAPMVRRRLNDGPAPLSSAQERLFLLDRMMPGVPVYNVPRLMRVGTTLDSNLLRD